MFEQPHFLFSLFLIMSLKEKTAERLILAIQQLSKRIALAVDVGDQWLAMHGMEEEEEEEVMDVEEDTQPPEPIKEVTNGVEAIKKDLTGITVVPHSNIGRSLGLSKTRVGFGKNTSFG